MLLFPYVLSSLQVALFYISILRHKLSQEDADVMHNNSHYTGPTNSVIVSSFGWYPNNCISIAVIIFQYDCHAPIYFTESDSFNLNVFNLMLPVLQKLSYGHLRLMVASS